MAITKQAPKSYIEFLIQSCGENTETHKQLSKLETTEISGSYKEWPAVIGDSEFADQIMDLHKISCTGIIIKLIILIFEDRCEQSVSGICISINGLKKKGKKNTSAIARVNFCYRLQV